MLLLAAENWAQACFPDTVQKMVDAFNRCDGGALKWLEYMGYGPGPCWNETWPEHREDVHRMSIALKRTGIRYDAVIYPNDPEDLVSTNGERILLGSRLQVAGEMALLAAEDMLYGLCSQSVGPLQFELLRAVNGEGRDVADPLLRKEGFGPLEADRHKGLAAAFRALLEISCGTLDDGSDTNPVACGELSKSFAKVVVRDGPSMGAVEDVISLVSLVPEGMLPFSTDGIGLCFETNTVNGILPPFMKPTRYEPRSRTLHVDPEWPSALSSSLASAFDFACGLCSASESFDTTFDCFMADIYGEPPELKKGTLKWYEARHEVFARMYEHYLSRNVPDIEDICIGFGPSRKVSEDIDVVCDGDMIFETILPNVHRRIADGSRQLVLYIKDRRDGENVLFDGKEWTLSSCKDLLGEPHALLVPADGDVSGQIEVKVCESLILDEYVVQSHDFDLRDVLDSLRSIRSSEGEDGDG